MIFKKGLLSRKGGSSLRRGELEDFEPNFCDFQNIFLFVLENEKKPFITTTNYYRLHRLLYIDHRLLYKYDFCKSTSLFLCVGSSIKGISRPVFGVDRK